VSLLDLQCRQLILTFDVSTHCKEIVSPEFPQSNFAGVHWSELFKSPLPICVTVPAGPQDTDDVLDALARKHIQLPLLPPLKWTCPLGESVVGLALSAKPVPEYAVKATFIIAEDVESVLEAQWISDILTFVASPHTRVIGLVAQSFFAAVQYAVLALFCEPAIKDTLPEAAHVGVVVSDAFALKHTHAAFFPPDIMSLPLATRVVGEIVNDTGSEYRIMAWSLTSSEMELVSPSALQCKKEIFLIVTSE
jgi:hypothetical protein